MRVAIKPIFEYEKADGESIKTFQDYQLRLKSVKTQMHCRYIVLIAVIFCVWAVTVKAGTNVEFASQLSFAATITSIILSVIAIWMSISGENKMTSVHNQMEDTAKRLSEATDQVEGVNNTIQVQLTEKLRQLDQICGNVENLLNTTENLGADIGIVKQSIEMLANSTGLKENDGKDPICTAEQIVRIFEKLLLGKDMAKNTALLEIGKYAMEYTLVIIQTDVEIIAFREIISYLEEIGKTGNKDIIMIVWQRICCLGRIGLNGNKEAQAKILSKLYTELSMSDNSGPIKEHHAKYQKKSTTKNVSDSI